MAEGGQRGSRRAGRSSCQPAVEWEEGMGAAGLEGPLGSLLQWVTPLTVWGSLLRVGSTHVRLSRGTPRFLGVVPF